MRAALFTIAFMLCFQGISADKEFIKRIEAKMEKVIIPELKADEVEEFELRWRKVAKNGDRSPKRPSS